MTVLVVVQARTGSSRLPGKVLADLGGRPMLALQLARLASLDCEHLAVATSDQPGDDAVEALARTAGVAVVRGSEADVLGRVGLALDRYPADTVVRLTGDCPLTDPGIVADTIALHLAATADYTTNVLPRSFPKGLDVEVMTAGALRTAVAEADGPGEREHVTPFLYRRPERFRLANLASGEDLGEEWWTVDTADDIARLRTMVDALPDPVGTGWHEILAIVGRQDGPPPGRVHLRPLPGPRPGSHPWVRSWEAMRDGEVVGHAEVAVGDGAASRTITGDQPAIAAALDGLLDGDQQISGAGPGPGTRP